MSPMASLHDVMICGLPNTCGTEFVGGLDKIAAIEQHGQKAVTDDFGEEDKVYDVEDVTTFSFTQALRVADVYAWESAWFLGLLVFLVCALGMWCSSFDCSICEI